MTPSATAPAAAVPDLVGGHVALDLVNTVSWRLDPARYRDHLTDVPALLTWCQRAGALEASPAPGLMDTAPEEVREGPVLQQVLDLREQLAQFLAALLDSPHADASPAAGDHDGGQSTGVVALVPPQLHTRLIQALTRSHLIGAPARWELTAQHLDDVPHLLALQALDLLQCPHLPFLRRCQGAGCGWMFLDRTRSHTRRWCSTSDCGNRYRAQRHYARTTRAGRRASQTSAPTNDT